MRDVIENGKSDEALSQIQKQEIRQYILNDARYFKETFDFLMDSRYTTEYYFEISLLFNSFSMPPSFFTKESSASLALYA
jgi:hypothetical protein